MHVRAEKEKKLLVLNRRLVRLASTGLYAYRLENGYASVPGEGSSNARVMFVGEAPGRKEAETGRPFVGAAGKQLDKLLASIGLTREEVFITSVVKDRPPDNRDPLPEEIAAYGPFLIAQIEIIQPHVLVALGRFALQFLLQYIGAPELGQTISALHGKSLRGRTPYGPVTLLPLYHPAVVLYGSKHRQALLDDFLVLKKLLRQKH